MISEDPKHMKTRAPAELCGEINLPRRVCYSLVNRHAGSKITALCKQQRVKFSKLKAKQTNLGFCGSLPESFVDLTPFTAQPGEQGLLTMG